jgi:hypothetical protein
LLHRRNATAEIQAEYLDRLLDLHGTPALRSALDRLTLEAICYFTPGPIRLGEDEPTSYAVAEYLSQLLGIEIAVVDVPALFGRTRAASHRLCRALEEPPDAYSAAERFVWALAALSVLTDSDIRPADRDEMLDVLDTYDAAVAQADPGADSFLKALAEYGRRWEVLVETEVPLFEPCTIKLTETRPLELDWWNGSVQPFNFADAESDHVQVRVSDQSVELAGFSVRSRERDGTVTLLDDRSSLAMGFDGVRSTRESLAIYSSAGDRPYYLDVRLRLRTARTSWFAALAIFVLTAVATVLAATTPADDHRVDSLALLAVPTTFAVAALLVREQTPLAARLQRRLRLAMLLALIALWVVVLTKLVTGR